MSVREDPPTKSDLSDALGPDSQTAEQVCLGDGKDKNGLAQLVLSLVNVLHELLEKQAIRRMEADTLSEEQLERLGTVLMRQAQEIERLRQEFDLEHDDLELNLGGVQYIE